MSADNLFGVNTRIIHGDYESWLNNFSVMPPLYDTTTYSFKTAEEFEVAFVNMLQGEKDINCYQRVGHFNSSFLEKCFCAIEPGSSSALVFNSGMAGITTTVLAYLAEKKEKSIYYTSPVYGGTHAFFHDVLPNYGVKVYQILSDVKSNYFGNLNKRSLGVVYVESPANPTMCIHDIEKISNEAKKIDPHCIVVVDNTFLGIFQKPLLFKNVDIVLYSATKFIGGHSDILAGVVVFKDDVLMKKVVAFRTVLGNILSPDSCKLLLRSLPSYEQRMRQQAKNAMKIVKFLQRQSKVGGVAYPGITAGKINPVGSVISIYLNADKEKTFSFLNTVGSSGIINLAVSLGGVESLISHPATTTHSEMSSEDLDKSGITPNLVRLSVGVEDVNDLIKILKKGFDKIK